MKLLFEHQNIPGAVYKDRLILEFGGCIFNDMELHEGTDATGSQVIKFRGKFQEAEAINKNKRMYPYDVLDENVTRLEETVAKGGLVGELDHPTDSIVHFKEASHKVTKLWWEGNTLMGEGTILSTPCGQILQSLINDGVRVGISSRGVGNGKVNEDGILVIGESYKLITFDAVADPSTNNAFQKRVSSKKESTIHSLRKRRNKRSGKRSMKNETTSIHNIDSNVLLACLGGIVKKQTGEIKARLS